MKKIYKDSWKGKTGILESTKNVLDSNYWHYALQLQLYEVILKTAKYIEKDAKVRRFINAFELDGFHQYELPSLMKEAVNLVKWRLSSLS